MTPDRRAKLFAMESCQATSENEKEICRRLLKGAPCEVCGGLLFYRKTGECEPCATRKKTQRTNRHGVPKNEDLWTDLRGYSYARPASCPQCGSFMMGSSGKCLRCLFDATTRPDPPEGRRGRIKCKACLNEIENLMIGCAVCNARDRARAATPYSCLDCGKPVVLARAVCGDCARVTRGPSWPSWQEMVVEPVAQEVKVEWHEAERKDEPKVWAETFDSGPPCLKCGSYTRSMPAGHCALCELNDL